jgi:hypothetical protein
VQAPVVGEALAVEARYLSEVMTRAGRDFRFSSSPSGSRNPPTGDTKASWPPSGDQVTPATPLSSAVSLVGSPPSAGMT